MKVTKKIIIPQDQNNVKVSDVKVINTIQWWLLLTHNQSPALSQVVCGSMASTDRELNGRRAAQHLVAGFADRDRLAGVVPW